MNLYQHLRKVLGWSFKPDPFIPSGRPSRAAGAAPPASATTETYWPDDQAIERTREQWRREEKERLEKEAFYRRKRILKRDNFRCQSSTLLTKGKPCCYPDGFKRRSRELHVHHIIPRSEGGTDDDENLITLCHICHRKMGESHCRVQKINKTKPCKRRYRRGHSRARG